MENTIKKTNEIIQNYVENNNALLQLALNKVIDEYNKSISIKDNEIKKLKEELNKK